MSYPVFGRKLKPVEDEEEVKETVTFGRKLKPLTSKKDQIIQERQQAYEQSKEEGLGQGIAKGVGYAVPEFVQGAVSLLDVPAKLIPQGEDQLTPGQQALFKAESNAPEKILPFLQDEDILPPIRKPIVKSELPAPTTGGEEVIRRFSRIYGETGATQPFLSLLATGGAEAAKSLGFEPETGELFTFLGSGFMGLLKLAKESPKLLKSGLTKLKGVGKRIPNFPKQVVKAKDYEKATELIQAEGQNLMAKIVEENVPISKLAKRNPQLETQINDLFKNVEQMAGNRSISTREFLYDLTNKISKIKGSALVPTEVEEGALRILNRYNRKFSIPKRFKKGKRVPIPISQKQMLKQFRNVNDNISTIMNGPRPFTPVQKGRILAYETIRDVLRKDLETAFGKDFGDLFKSTNNVYHKLKNFQALESVLDPIFNAENLNYKALEKLTSKPKTREILLKNLGKDGYDQFLQLQSDLLDTDQLFKSFKVKDSKGLANALGGISSYALMTALKVPAYLKIGFSGRKIPKAVRESIKFAKSRALLNPETRSLSLRLKDALKKGDKATAIVIGKRMEDILTEKKS